MKTFRYLFVLQLAFVTASTTQADVKLPAILSDHMVVQSGTKVPIWGWADAGEKVTATLAGQTASAVADADGKWKLTFTDLAVGGPHVLSVEGKNKLAVNDVLVGEVWLGSGQSNMAMTVNRCLNYAEEQSAANLPTLRMFSVARNPLPEPTDDCEGAWVVCAPDTVGGFSATLYFFGRDVQKQLQVPMGLINSSYGGTAIESWTSMPAQQDLPEYKTISATWEAAKQTPFSEEKAEANYQKARAAFVEAAKKAKADGKPAPRPPQKAVAPGLDRNHPSNLFNGMINPIVGYAIRGAVWYQGENNSNKPFRNLYGLQLRTLVKDWRTRWGYDFPFAWVQLPDYKAPQKNPVEADQSWPVIREQMAAALDTPATGMAVTLGLGEEKDIHPRNKQGVGQRLAMWALAEVYGKDGSPSGPLLAEHKIDGDKVILRFYHADGGLRSHDGGALKGFAIAGADGKFVWADAKIDGERVVVSSPDVKEPTAVRYAWADNPVWSLENGAGLPASPFRTDVDAAAEAK